MGEVDMKKRLRQITQMVEWCLDRYPETRSSDRELIKVLYEEFYSIWAEPFYMVLNRNDLPSFESIRRCRQKIQEEHEEYRAVKPIEDKRIEVQADYIAYARGEEA